MINPYSGAGFFEFFAIFLQRMLSFSFSPVSDEIQLAVLASCAVGCGLLAPFLVLKRMSMFANSLSHTSLIGVVGAFLFASHFWGSGLTDPSTLVIGALLSALVTAGLIELMTKGFKLQEDAGIGLVFTSLFALGVILVSLYTRNSHLSAEAVMGNPDALQPSDFKLAAGIAAANALFVALLFRKLLLASFDEGFAKATGAPLLSLRALLFLLTAITAIGAFRAIGALVVLALLVGPYLTARLFCHRLERLVIWTPLLGLAEACCGVALSRAILSYTGLALSTGGIIAALIGAVFAGSLLIKTAKKSLHKKAVAN